MRALQILALVVLVGCSKTVYQNNESKPQPTTTGGGGGGDVVGNGGDALVCESGEVIFYDLYESKMLRYTPENLYINKKPSEILEIVFFKLQPELKEVFAFIPEYVKDFERTSRIAETDLVDIGDSLHFISKPQCTFVQAAIHVDQLLPGDVRYVVDRRIWEKMKPTSQAALILHEILMRKMVELDQKNTKVLRMIVGYLMSDLDSQMMNCKVLQAIQTYSLFDSNQFSGLVNFQRANCSY